MKFDKNNNYYSTMPLKTEEKSSYRDDEQIETVRRESVEIISNVEMDVSILEAEVSNKSSKPFYATMTLGRTKASRNRRPSSFKRRFSYREKEIVPKAQFRTMCTRSESIKHGEVDTLKYNDYNWQNIYIFLSGDILIMFNGVTFQFENRLHISKCKVQNVRIFGREGISIRMKNGTYFLQFSNKFIRRSWFNQLSSFTQNEKTEDQVNSRINNNSPFSPGVKRQRLSSTSSNNHHPALKKLKMIRKSITKRTKQIKNMINNL